MHVFHQRAVGCLYLIYIALLRIGYGVVLDRVRNVMVEARRPLTYPPGPIRALYASFNSLSPAYVQLWKNSSSPNAWFLDWQVEVVPKYGNGSIEIINIPISEQVSIDPDHRLGLTNIAFPGPLKGFHDLRGGLILSTNRTPSQMPKVNDLFSFDDLPLPYQIPVFFCNRTDCPDELVRPTTPSTSTTMTPSVAPVVFENMFLDDRLILGLLIWNVILSLLVLILLFALLCLCLDLEKKRRLKSRYDIQQRHQENFENTLPTVDVATSPTPGPSSIYMSHDPSYDTPRDPYSTPFTPSYAYDNKDMMQENRESNSDSYHMSMESMERLPSTSF